MRYERKFMIQAAHFNNEQAYKHYYSALIQPENAVELLKTVLNNIHGHNFFITVEVSGTFGKLPWLIDDISLTDVVMDWDNQNLSAHRDFLKDKLRATTENMASVLWGKLTDIWPKLRFKITVEETPNIKAIHGDLNSI